MADLAAGVTEALRAVRDPELGNDVVTLDMVKGIEESGGAVTVTLELTTPACPLKGTFEAAVKEAVGKVAGVKSVAVRFPAGRAVSRTGTLRVPNAVRLGGIRNVVAVASGKGGVGKSTVAANLALALRDVGSSRVDLQACKLEYSIVSPK